MGGTIGKMISHPSVNIKNAFDPAGLVHHDGGPRTFGTVLQGVRGAFDPAGTELTQLIADHNNTQNNFRGYMDPGQLLGSNATTAPGFDPSTFKLPTGTGYNPSIGAPANGIATNGLTNGVATNGLAGPSQATTGLPGQQPNWAAIIANAMRK